MILKKDNIERIVYATSEINALKAAGYEVIGGEGDKEPLEPGEYLIRAVVPKTTRKAAKAKATGEE